MKSLILRQWEATAYAAGTLTQIRRVVKPQPFVAPYRGGADMLELKHKGHMMIHGQAVSHYVTNSERHMTEALRSLPCPYGAPGDNLELREAATQPLSAVRHRPTIQSVRLERVQDASNLDFQRLGLLVESYENPNDAWDQFYFRYEVPYRKQFTRDNPRTPWESNPWCWVLDINNKNCPVHGRGDKA